ncbi:putative metallopeptidase [Raoultella terrigena]|uniref:putative metallopeptidase n=1 Tax=Raoultella terrigena TaxID=577 RepID=UPI003F5D5158
MSVTKAVSNRPFPPVNFTGENWLPYTRIIPAAEIGEWVNQHILSDEGRLHNPDHEHLANALADADIAFMWASGAFAKSGRVVLGQCEQVMMRAGGWQKSRMEQQMHEWFGRIPKFIITLAADYCEQCNDLEFCALIEHELYHIAQATDDYGAPKFNKETGMPVLKLRGHDVEEFVGVVRRYGASKDVQEMVDAAKRPAEVAHIDVARACGTCMLKLA